MFEKEAEEYSTSSKVDYINNIAITLVQQAYKDGAVFGYKKGIKIRNGKIPRACSNCKSKDTCSAFIPLGRCRIGYKETENV